MSQIKRIGLDTSKAVFTLHCVDQTGQTVLRTNLRRAQMATYFKKLAPAEIVLEACGRVLLQCFGVGREASARRLSFPVKRQLGTVQR